MVSSRSVEVSTPAEDPQTTGRGMRRQGWVNGKASPWLTAGMALCIVGVSLILWLGGRAVSEKGAPSDSLNLGEMAPPTHRYKIERSDQGPAVESVAKETPLAAAQEIKVLAGEQKGDSELTGLESRAVSSPKALDRQGGAPGDASRSDLSERPEADALKGNKTGPVLAEKPAPGKEDPAKRFFVKPDAANVRDEPSLEASVLFQVQKGCSLTVIEEQEGWRRIRMDDGRVGWVYHALLSDALVPQGDFLLQRREIRAICVEPQGNETGRTAKVSFKLTSACVPEIQMLEGEAPRLVCDFFDTQPASCLGPRITVNNGIVEAVRIGLHREPRVKVRVVLDLTPGQRYEATQVSQPAEEIVEVKISALESF